MKDAIGVAMLLIGFVVLMAAVFTLPVYYLWNWLSPAIFEGPTITLWQALGVSLLSQCLFKSSSSSSK